MKIIVGLGNPGKDYSTTRHNIGFMVIDELSKALNVELNKSKFKSLYGETHYKGEKLLLVKPLTFMNNSGEAVRDLMNFYKLDSSDLLVIYDDIDINFSDIRIRKKGSSGSHNGMKSIIYNIQSDDFPRIRIGIGQKHEKQDLANFVLSTFSKEEKEEIEIAVKNTSDAVLCIVENGVDQAMNKFNIKNK